MKNLLLLGSLLFTTVLFAGTGDEEEKKESATKLASIPPAAHRNAAGFAYDETKESGYVGMFEFGGSFGIAGRVNWIAGPTALGPSPGKITYGQNFFSFQTIQGRQLNRKIYMGFGLGFDIASPNPNSHTINTLNTLFSGVYQYYYNVNNASPYSAAKHDFLVPLFMDVRGTFLRGRISPFLDGKIGYAGYFPAPLSGYTYTAGVMVALGVGARVFLTHRTAFNLTLGYRMQNLMIQVPSYPGGTPPAVNEVLPKEFQQEFFHYITLMAGFSF